MNSSSSFSSTGNLETIFPTSNLSSGQSSISIYDNSNNNSSNSFIGIVGDNDRARAFEKLLISSSFSTPIRCDSIETYRKFDPSILIVTDEISLKFEFDRTRTFLIDARRISTPLIDGSFRAFGNLSNSEIEKGTNRIAVAIESNSPETLSEFIVKLRRFPRGILRLDSFSYENLRRKPFENSILPLILSLIFVVFYSIVSIFEYKNEFFHSRLVYRQISSVSAATSLTLFAVRLLAEPIDEFVQLIHWTFFQRRNEILKFWLNSRLFLVVFSFVFAYFHLIFLLFSRLDSNSILFLVAFLLGLFSLIGLTIVFVVNFPSISERLVSFEFVFLNSFLSLVVLFLSFLHVFLHWALVSDMFNVKFVSMICPLIFFVFRSMIFVLISPIIKFLSRK